MGNDASTEFSIFADGELEAELRKHGGTGDISVKKLLEQGYNDVVRSVIRPPRAKYTIDQLGEIEFELPAQAHGGETEHDGRVVRRHDFDIKNERELKLRCSHWQIYPNEDAKHAIRGPCLVYLHSNIGSRLDALRVRDLALARGFSVFAFDFSGSGLSDGIYVTAGWNECKDLHFVLEYLEDEDSVDTICFFAHSMGTFPAIVNVACRSLLASEKTKDKLQLLPSYFRTENVNTMGKPIKGMILDGGYATMSKLTEELLISVQAEGFKVPLSLLKLASKVIQQSVKKRADVDLNLLRPIDFVEACYIPALFIAGESDRYVAPRHSEKLAAKYAGPAVNMKVEGEHYTLRSEQVYQDALDFLFGSIRSAGMRG